MQIGESHDADRTSRIPYENCLGSHMEDIALDADI